jgi:hypothetical protein
MERSERDWAKLGGEKEAEQKGDEESGRGDLVPEMDRAELPRARLWQPSGLVSVRGR